MQLGQIISREVNPDGLFALDLRILAQLLVNQGFGILDQLLAFRLHAHTFSIQQHLFTPGSCPRSSRISDNRSDLAQCVVVFLCDTGVSGQNNIRISIRDGFEIKTVSILENVRIGYAQLVQLLFGPREQSAAVLNTEVRCGEADRNHTKCQCNVMVGPLNRNYPFRLALDDSLAQCMLDRNRILCSISGWGFGTCSFVRSGRTRSRCSS
ncbi:hypothetical protein D3C73_1006260 [compost metagenome]